VEVIERTSGHFLVLYRLVAEGYLGNFSLHRFLGQYVQLPSSSQGKLPYM
jgi:hypothetical protein